MIYFVECGGLVKIGTAINVPQRVSHMQTGNPMPLKLLGTILGDRVIEQKLHKRFKALHFNGEWFHHTGALRAFVESGFDAPYATLKGNSDFFGLLGREEEFARSFYRAYVRSSDSGWWRYEWGARPAEYDPVARQARLRVGGAAQTVRCRLRDLKGYVCDPERPALKRLLELASCLGAVV